MDEILEILEKDCRLSFEDIAKMLKKKTQMAKAPALIYQEGDVVTRVFRDVITDDVAEIIVDDQVVLDRAREFLRETAPANEPKLKLDEIRAAIRAKGLTNLCVPREVKYLREIPKLGTGKVNHRELVKLV